MRMCHGKTGKAGDIGRADWQQHIRLQLHVFPHGAGHHNAVCDADGSLYPGGGAALRDRLFRREEGRQAYSGRGYPLAALFAARQAALALK